VNKVLVALLLAGTLALVGCQQTQEADENTPDTVVKEKETVVQPAPAPAPDNKPDVDVDVNTGGDQSGGQSGGGAQNP
jgi:hypothetical protein